MKYPCTKFRCLLKKQLNEFTLTQDSNAFIPSTPHTSVYIYLTIQQPTRPNHPTTQPTQPCPIIIYTRIYKGALLTLQHVFLPRPRDLHRALGSMASREPARTPHASLCPGRGPWHVPWVFKVACPLGEGFQTRRAIQAHANPRTG